MSEPAAPPRFSPVEVADALQVFARGRAWRDMMGHSTRINRLAKTLAVMARPMPRTTDRFVERRLVLTPEEARRLNDPR